MKMSYSTYSSETIRISNVHIPFYNGKNYGSGFVYMSLPGFMADIVAAAGKSRRPTVVTETSLAPDSERWWKIVNNIDGKVGVVEGGSFKAKSLESIFESSGRGVTVSVVGSFVARASTTDKSQLKPTTPQRVVFELNRAYIAAVDVDVQMPVRIPKTKPKPEPLAVKEDVATDSLLKRVLGHAYF